MDFEYSADEESFRAEVRGFIEEHLKPKDQRGPNFLAEWLEKVREKGWVGFSWPKEFGGSDGGLIEQTILREEMALAKAPPLGASFMGLAWVGPGIMQYGTEEQKKQFIPDILDSKVTWCTGYSEPNHGSDLAAIQCKAERDGDHYVINGQKTWTSGASWSPWTPLASTCGPSKTWPATDISPKYSSPMSGCRPRIGWAPKGKAGRSPYRPLPTRDLRSAK
jgi:alkylation response protein AidB-like acyl-CoA dehydrogenase